MKKLPCLDEEKIEYTIIKTKTNRLTLKFDRNGILKVRVPRLATKNQVNDFVKRHLDWIKVTKKATSLKKVSLTNGSNYLYLGRNYTLQIVLSRHTGVFIKDNDIICYANDLNDVPSVLNKWKLQQAELIFNELLFKCFDKMKNYLDIYPKLSIKHYLSRWGCCYTKRNQIILNISLIHVKLELIEFVIYHELSHFKYQNHQEEFHSFLQMFCPNERKLSKMLKDYHLE